VPWIQHISPFQDDEILLLLSLELEWVMEWALGRVGSVLECALLVVQGQV
jgi:hypothetical protein